MTQPVLRQLQLLLAAVAGSMVLYGVVLAVFVPTDGSIQRDQDALNAQGTTVELRAALS